MPTDVRAESRRQFLRFLAESPLLYSGASAARWPRPPRTRRTTRSCQARWTSATSSRARSKPERLGLRDRDPRAAQRRPLRLHRAGLRRLRDDRREPRRVPKIGLRPRRLVDVGTVDLSVDVFGQRLSSPIFLCPVGAQLMFHRRRRSRRRARRQEQERAADAVDRHELFRRGRRRGARRAGLVPALFDVGLAEHGAHAEARRRLRLHGRRLDRRHPDAQLRARRALRPRQRSRLPGLPRRHASRSVQDAAHVRRRRHDESAHGPRGLELGLRRAAQRRDEDEGAAERHSDARGRGALPRARRRRHRRQ